jgi:hypothetical protein
MKGLDFHAKKSSIEPPRGNLVDGLPRARRCSQIKPVLPFPMTFTACIVYTVGLTSRNKCLLAVAGLGWIL